MNVLTFVNNNSIHYHTTSILKQGKWFRIVNDVEVSEDLFKKLYPISHNGRLKTFKDYPKGSNPDKTKIV